MGKIIAKLSPGRSAGRDPWAWGILVNHRKLYDIIHKLKKNQLIFVTDKIEEGRKFVSQSEKRVSKSYKQ